MLYRNETDSRISTILTDSILITAAAATQLPPVDVAGLQAASVYIANYCTGAIHYDIKGCYDKNVSSTSYWYSITSGTAAATSVTCIGAFGGAGSISALGNHHKAITVEYFASTITSVVTGSPVGAVIQLAVW